MTHLVSIFFFSTQEMSTNTASPQNHHLARNPTLAIQPLHIGTHRGRSRIIPRLDIDVREGKFLTRRLFGADERDGSRVDLLVCIAREVLPCDVAEREPCGRVLGARRDAPSSPVGALLEEDRRGGDVLDVEVFEHCSCQPALQD